MAKIHEELRAAIKRADNALNDTRGMTDYRLAVELLRPVLSALANAAERYTEELCPACGAPCVYKYCEERARDAELFGNDQVFLVAYRDHAKRLETVKNEVRA